MLDTADQLLPMLLQAPAAAQLLFATLAARLPLSNEQWASLLRPGVVASLPAVLARLQQEASWMARHTFPAEQQRLRTFALRLAHELRQTDRPLLRQLLSFLILVFPSSLICSLHAPCVHCM